MNKLTPGVDGVSEKDFMLEQAGFVKFMGECELKEIQRKRYDKVLEDKGLKGRLSPKDPTIALFYAAGPPIAHLTLLIGNFIVR